MNMLKIAFLLFCFSFVYSQEELSQKQNLLSQKQKQLNTTEQKIIQARNENNKAKEDLISAEKEQKEKVFDYENKKSAFDRASKNVDLVSSETLNQLSKDYKSADLDMRRANEKMQEKKLAQQKTEKNLKQLISEKEQLENDINNLNGDIFDIHLRKPVWVVGESICNLAENETPDQCRKRALTAAQKDAMEKGGKMVLESETIVRNYQLYLDEIRTHIKAQILEQDNSPQYGIKREIIGDNIRYVAKLRLKIQSVSTYNPYRRDPAITDQKLKNEYKSKKTVARAPITKKGRVVTFDEKHLQFVMHGVIEWEKDERLKNEFIRMEIDDNGRPFVLINNEAKNEQEKMRGWLRIPIASKKISFYTEDLKYLKITAERLLDQAMKVSISESEREKSKQKTLTHVEKDTVIYGEKFDGIYFGAPYKYDRNREHVHIGCPGKARKWIATSTLKSYIRLNKPVAWADPCN